MRMMSEPPRAKSPTNEKLTGKKTIVNTLQTLEFVPLQFLGANSTSIRDCVRRSVGWLVGPSPAMQLRGKLVTSRLLREEEKEEDYVAIPLRRDSFAPRD
jgi:hypothetical protein